MASLIKFPDPFLKVRLTSFRVRQLYYFQTIDSLSQSASAEEPPSPPSPLPPPLRSTHLLVDCSALLNLLVLLPYFTSSTSSSYPPNVLLPYFLPTPLLTCWWTAVRCSISWFSFLSSSIFLSFASFSSFFRALFFATDLLLVSRLFLQKATHLQRFLPITV